MVQFHLDLDQPALLCINFPKIFQELQETLFQHLQINACIYTPSCENGHLSVNVLLDVLYRMSFTVCPFYQQNYSHFSFSIYYKWLLFPQETRVKITVVFIYRKRSYFWNAYSSSLFWSFWQCYSWWYTIEHLQERNKRDFNFLECFKFLGLNFKVEKMLKGNQIRGFISQMLYLCWQQTPA